jgi:Flp pilus assembly protein TadD
MYKIYQIVKPCKLFRIFNLDSTNTLIALGKSQLEKGNFNDALSSFEQAILLDQNNPDLWNLKGTALRSLGRYNEAIDCFNKSLEIDPRDKNSS